MDGDFTFDLVVHGGTVITGAGARRCDVGVRDGRVVEVGRIDSRRGRGGLDAKGLLVLPGAVDEHVHPVYLDDAVDTARAAAFGGTTTLMHFAYAHPGENLVDPVKRLIDEASGGLLDFLLHVGFFDSPTQADDIERVGALGVRSFKMFLTYAALGWMTDDYQLLRIMERVAEVGGLAMVHAENGPAIEYLEAEAAAGRRRGRDAVETWVATRPPALEAEAVFRAIAIAEVGGCDLFIPHVTSRRALDVVRLARERGAHVVAETCPHYLTLTDDVLRERGSLAKVGPPLRKNDDIEALWSGIREGVLSAIGSDHAPKKRSSEPEVDLLDAGFGAPAVETLLPVVYDAGVNSGRISVVELVRLVCENPARIFGLYPRKGTITVGSDADIVIWDPQLARQITAATQHSNAGYTLYEGRDCLGAPRVVIRRGEVLVRDGELVGGGNGEFLPSGTFDVLLP